MSLPFNIVLWSVVGLLILEWAKLPATLRRGIAKALLASGLICLAVAPFLEGEYANQVALYIGGPNIHQVETIERSFTVLFLGIGFLLLGLYAPARWGERLPWKSPLNRAFALTLAMIVLRVTVEKLAAPTAVAMFFGIIWLVVPIALYFSMEAAKAGSLRLYWRWLFGYTFGTRALIAIIMVAATYFQLGTHFDNSSVTVFTAFGKSHTVAAGSWAQYRDLILFPQFLLWTSVTLLVGLLFGLPGYVIFSHRSAQQAENIGELMRE